MSGVKTELQAQYEPTFQKPVMFYATIQNLQVPLHISTKSKFYEHIISRKYLSLPISRNYSAYPSFFR